MIYFLECQRYVKIGMTTDVHARVKSIKVCCPLPMNLLRTIEGGRNTELFLHEKFKHLRCENEWFLYSTEMMTIEPKISEKKPELKRTKLYEYLTANSITFDRFRRLVGCTYIEACSIAAGQTIPSEHTAKMIAQITHGEIVFDSAFSAQRQ